MKIAVKETWLGIRNSHTRIPFRYGKACLTACPQALAKVVLEADGRRQAGFAGDCLPPLWFDKSPHKSFRQQVDDMLAVIGWASSSLLEHGSSPTEFFPSWQAVYDDVHALAERHGQTPLLASFGASLWERAVIDAICRAVQLPFARLVRSDLLEWSPGQVHAELEGLRPRDWLPPEPSRRIFVRHTVGLGDALSAAEVSAEDRVDDGPISLEEYLEQAGVKYFKVKVSNQLESDIERLARLADVVQRRRGSDYYVTLDGNEQYGSPAEFDELVAAVEADPRLTTLWSNTLAIEQPLERSIALDSAHTAGIRQLCRRKPVIIDESDAALDSYRRALAVGYRGVSSKACKGAIKSLLNAGLTWLRNGRSLEGDCLMTGEDLCSVGIAPVQMDLCLSATLGLQHVERNGHHYHPGISYLPQSEQQKALAAHGDFYGQTPRGVGPRVVDGCFEIRTLVECVGFGVAMEHSTDPWTAAERWQFDSLGLE